MLDGSSSEMSVESFDPTSLRVAQWAFVIRVHFVKCKMNVTACRRAKRPLHPYPSGPHTANEAVVANFPRKTAFFKHTQDARVIDAPGQSERSCRHLFIVLTDGSESAQLRRESTSC